MGYRVRNEHGEIRFETFDALQEAYLHDLVDPTDEVLEDGGTLWRKANTLPRLVAAANRSAPLTRGPAKWYLLALSVLLLGVGLIYFVSKAPGVAAFLLVFGIALAVGGLMTWLSARQRPR